MSDLSPFWDKLADKYAAKPIDDEAAYRTKVATTQSYLTPEMELFEFGCGTGGTALTHAPYVRHVRAIDFSTRMLDHARGNARKAGISNVTFEQGDINSMPIAPMSYDMVLGLSILHLLENRDTVIDRVYDIVRPGGLFVSSTACLGDSMKTLGFIATIGRWLGKLPYLDIMSRDELLHSLAKAGFTIEHEWHPSRMAAVFIIARKPA